VLFLERQEVVGSIKERVLILTSGSSAKDYKYIPGNTSPELTAELEVQSLTMGSPIFLRLFKDSQELEVWMEKEKEGAFVLFKTFPLCKLSGELGPKQKSRDKQAPEGFYYVAPRGMKPQSRYHRELEIAYPNDYDKAQDWEKADIRIQGGCRSNGGSFGLKDSDVEEIFSLAGAAFSGNQPFIRVHIFPFRMSDARMDQVVTDKSEWLDFWSNLKEGYDYFEIVRRPPDTQVKGGKYVFE